MIVVRIDVQTPFCVAHAAMHRLQCLYLRGLKPRYFGFGADLKNTFCLIKDGDAILSQHMGDLEDPSTLAELSHNLALYENIYEHAPKIIVVDQQLPTTLQSWAKKKLPNKKPALLPCNIITPILLRVWRKMLALDGAMCWGLPLMVLAGGQMEQFGGEFLACPIRAMHVLPV